MQQTSSKCETNAKSFYVAPTDAAVAAAFLSFHILIHIVHE